jgi:hypothetical protein
MRTCPDCHHEAHPGVTCGKYVPGSQCFCQAPPCRHPGFDPVREPGPNNPGRVVGYVCVECHGPFEVNEVEQPPRSSTGP